MSKLVLAKEGMVDQKSLQMAVRLLWTVRLELEFQVFRRIGRLTRSILVLRRTVRLKLEFQVDREVDMEHLGFTVDRETEVGAPGFSKDREVAMEPMMKGSSEPPRVGVG
eukprot:2697514-Amphidinium_carterae.2